MRWRHARRLTRVVIPSLFAEASACRDLAQVKIGMGEYDLARAHLNRSDDLLNQAERHMRWLDG